MRRWGASPETSVHRQGGDTGGKSVHRRPGTALGRGREGVGTPTAVRSAQREPGWEHKQTGA